MIVPKDGLLKFEHISSTNAGNYWCEVITLAGHSLKSQIALLTVLGMCHYISNVVIL